MTQSDKRPQQRTDTAHDNADTERAARQVRAQLEQRGVHMHDADDAEGIARVLEAVEAFEAAVRQRGGDSYTNAPGTRRPDRAEFQLPERGDDERADTFARRVQHRTDALVATARDGGTDPEPMRDDA